MKKLAIVLAVGAAALMGGSAANAADNSVKAQAPVAAKQVHTDISSRHRHGHWRHHHHHRRWGHHHHHHRHWGHRHHRPYYNSYGYHGGPRHYGGGPGVTFSFGSGGYRGW